jgi:hypothetical protein
MRRIYIVGATASVGHAPIFRDEPENGNTVLLPTYRITARCEILQKRPYIAETYQTGNRFQILQITL